QPTPAPVAPPVVPTPTPAPPSPSPAASVAPARPANALTSVFYGMGVWAPPTFLGLKPLPAKLTQSAIADFWQEVSNTKYADYVSALVTQRDNADLGDWGFARLAYALNSRVSNGDARVATLLTWFVMTKAGYVVRIGYNDTRVFLLLKSTEQL